MEDSRLTHAAADHPSRILEPIAEEESEEWQQILYQQQLQAKSPTLPPSANSIPDVFISYPQDPSVEHLGLKGYCKAAPNCESCSADYARHLYSTSKSDFSCGWDRTVPTCRVVVGWMGDQDICPTNWETNPVLRFFGAFTQRSFWSKDVRSRTRSVGSTSQENLMVPGYGAAIEVFLANLVLILGLYYFGKGCLRRIFYCDDNNASRMDKSTQKRGKSMMENHRGRSDGVVVIESTSETVILSTPTANEICGWGWDDGKGTCEWGWDDGKGTSTKIEMTGGRNSAYGSLRRSRTKINHEDDSSSNKNGGFLSSMTFTFTNKSQMNPPNPSYEQCYSSENGLKSRPSSKQHISKEGKHVSMSSKEKPREGSNKEQNIPGRSQGALMSPCTNNIDNDNMGKGYAKLEEEDEVVFHEWKEDELIV